MSQNNIQNRPLTIIEPLSSRPAIDIQELWEYRELLFFFSWREISIRYKQTILGILWAVLLPFTTMVVFTIFFGNLAKIATNGIPYPIFSFSALVPFTFFTQGLTSVSGSMVANSGLIKKIYFPRIILPLSNVFSALADFAIAFVILVLMILVYIGFGLSVPDAAGDVAMLSITPNVFLIPVFIALAFLTSLGFGLWLAPLHVQFRDVRYVTPVLIRLWMFVTPVIYPVDLVGERWLFLYRLNPMVSVIDGFRWSLLGHGSFPGQSLAIGLITTTIILVSGFIFFHHNERTFADVV